MKNNAFSRENLIIALDYPEPEAARETVRRLDGLVSFYKVGLELFLAAGPPICSFLQRSGARFFLDLKFFDIPNTVAGASRMAVRLGADMFNLHLLAGREGLAAARESRDREAARLGRPVPLMVGVTILTSSGGGEWREIGLDAPVPELVHGLAGRAAAAGLDGVVASPLEAARLKKSFGAPFLVVAPGIRPGRSRDDQERVLTPAAAVKAGCDYLVIGRPVTAAPDPARACAAIIEEIESGAAKGIDREDEAAYS